ncbi:MAG: ribonuclease H family protein [Saprospiraceae bacterium]|nr:ribonuclease H family protein [Saprospiraceae bacterium]
MADKKKYYVVWQGHNPGIYDSWDKCQQQIKNYPNAKYKSFGSREEADIAFGGNYAQHIQFKAPSKPGQTTAPQSAIRNPKSAIVWDSISVDAACSGNPGVMEYQGVDTRTKTPIFHQKHPLGTNNIGEFLAIVHALAMFHQQGKDTPIYTDSRTAIGWVKLRACKTKLVRNAKTENLHQIIARAENWLKTHTYKNPILKWETEDWGEIPADFGRK